MNLLQVLTDFINKYNNVPNVGNTPENKGQCVGLSQVWIQTLGLPFFYGNAKDLLNNAPQDSFDVIHNNPQDLSQFPVLGDILVWNEKMGGGFGHTGVVVDANGQLVKVFEQNYTPGHAPEILQHNYDNVLGWLHPKLENAVTADEGKYYRGFDTTNIESVKVAFDAVIRLQAGDLVDKSTFQQQLDATTSCQTQLKTALDQNEKDQVIIANLQRQLHDVQSKYDEDEREIIALKDELAKVHSSDKDYATKAYESEQLAKKNDSVIKDLAAELKVEQSDDKSLADKVAEAVVKSIDKLEELSNRVNNTVTIQSDVPVSPVVATQTSLAPSSNIFIKFFKVFFV